MFRQALNGHIPRAFRPVFRTVKVHAGGKGFGIYIPRVVLNYLDIGKGDTLVLYVIDKTICLEVPNEIGMRPNVVSRRELETEKLVVEAPDAAAKEASR